MRRTLKTQPTERTYGSLSAAYDHFNRTLFAGELPPCLITVQRHKGAYGYFSGERFASVGDPEEVTDEIALNPTHFADRTPAETLSTLVHEMVHLWQHHFGKAPRRCYHDRQWAKQMRTVGLIPTDTGEQGGKETGQKVTHYIEQGGAFDKACSSFLAKNPAALYHDRAGEDAVARRKKAASKTKYTCPSCELNAWAKPGVLLICGECEEELEPSDDGEA